MISEGGFSFSHHSLLLRFAGKPRSFIAFA